MKEPACTQQNGDSATSGLQPRAYVLIANSLLLLIEQKPKGWGGRARGTSAGKGGRFSQRENLSDSANVLGGRYKWSGWGVVTQGITSH